MQVRLSRKSCTKYNSCKINKSLKITNHRAKCHKGSLHSGMFKQSVYACFWGVFKIIIECLHLPDLLELARCTSNMEIDANV